MMKRHKKGEQLHRNLISAQARFSRVHERQKKGAQMHRNLMGGLARLCLRGIRKNHKKREQLHRNLVDGQARFSLREGDNIAAEDFISELPEEILCYIASFLPLREAARTSILARKWRYLWRSLLNLNFDVTNMTGNEYELREMVTCSDLIFRYYGDREANLLQKKELSFVMWVNQVLELHDSGKIKSCKIDFPLDGQYSDNLDSCIQNLATKGVEELHIKLSGHDMYRRCSYKLCKFPYWHFARVEGSSSLKHLALDYCAFNPKNNFSCLSNLISLSLKHIDFITR
ncbi:hypothetical protein ACH5RR_031525 [Cinchona calisaya]|uniref:F-box domain-containing protein n=1 Tax=Cinchona calisaya TaxID=153742 RepID=A0ABD2YFH9_9GENT